MKPHVLKQNRCLCRDRHQAGVGKGSLALPGAWVTKGPTFFGVQPPLDEDTAHALTRPLLPGDN